MTLTKPRLYLLDVEGTTSPLSLVYEQLFPYARKHMEAFLRGHLHESEVEADVAKLANLRRIQCAATQSDLPIRSFPCDPDAEAKDPILAATHYLLTQMDADIKDPILKRIQGRTWKSGFLNGELIGTLFPDVAGALERWCRTANVAIYSSGSVEAQQLLFRFSSAGDLTSLISGYFDTGVGPKTSPESYRAIAAGMGVETGEVLFVSDVTRELDPAREAGCQTRLSVREGNQAVPDAKGHTVTRSFVEIG